MKLFVGYSKAPKQPQTSARPICQSRTMTSTGRKPATICIAAYRSSPRYALRHGRRHMTNTGNHIPDLLNLSPVLYTLGCMLPQCVHEFCWENIHIHTWCNHSVDICCSPDLIYCSITQSTYENSYSNNLSCISSSSSSSFSFPFFFFFFHFFRFYH